ncbi:hypothetical protein [Burkholderia pseudomallei]|uniref:hypothetical protein n=1 Tax=Burkholderia pseudomallei TaxID=28450 RepID=UPI00235E03DA|nr:hypothetical protein [Burkholderia pseudomallei]
MDDREQILEWMGDNDVVLRDGAFKALVNLLQAAGRTTPDREVVTKLAEINGQLREQIERYQAVCAAAYQLVGVVDGPLRFLDALSNAANGEPMSTEDALNLLPVTLDECDSFRTAPTSDKGGA